MHAWSNEFMWFANIQQNAKMSLIVTLIEKVVTDLNNPAIQQFMLDLQKVAVISEKTASAIAQLSTRGALSGVSTSASGGWPPPPLTAIPPPTGYTTWYTWRVHSVEWQQTNWMPWWGRWGRATEAQQGTPHILGMVYTCNSEQEWLTAHTERNLRH